MGIRSIGGRATKRFAKGSRHHLPPSLVSKISDVLERLEQGASPADLRADRYRLHRLTGDRKGMHTVATSGGWRVVFRFADGNAYDVEVVAYQSS